MVLINKSTQSISVTHKQYFKNTILDTVLTCRKDMGKVPIFLDTDFWKISGAIVLHVVLTLTSNFGKTFKTQQMPFQY